jgi:hypothetical protein
MQQVDPLDAIRPRGVEDQVLSESTGRCIADALESFDTEQIGLARRRFCLKPPERCVCRIEEQQGLLGALMGNPQAVLGQGVQSNGATKNQRDRPAERLFRRAVFPLVTAAMTALRTASNSVRVSGSAGPESRASSHWRSAVAPPVRRSRSRRMTSRKYSLTFPRSPAATHFTTYRLIGASMLIVAVCIRRRIRTDKKGCQPSF